MRHAGWMRSAIGLTLLLSACVAPPNVAIGESPSAGTSPTPPASETQASGTPTPASPPVASGPRVELVFSSHESHSPTGHRIYLWPRTASDDVVEVRIAGPGLSAPVTGDVVAVTQTWGCVSRVPRAATLAVPIEVLHAWQRQETAAAFDIVARMGTSWYPARIISAGCFSIE